MQRKTIINHLLIFFCCSFIPGLFFALLNLIYYSPLRALGTDTISWINAGVSPILNNGVAYKDYWDRMPPGLGLIVFIWAKIFSYSDLSFQIMHFVSLLFLIILFYLVFKKISDSLIILPAIISSYIIAFSPNLISYQLTSEQLGLLFALTGLILFLYRKDHLLFIFFGSFFLFLSSQMKDPFLPSLICFLPILLYYSLLKKSLIKVLFTFLLGILSGLTIIVIYLSLLGNLNDYLNILVYKSSVFNIFNWQNLTFSFWHLFVQITKEFFQFYLFLPLIPIIILTVFFIEKFFINKEISLKTGKKAILIYRPKKAVIFDLERIINSLIVLFFILGNHLGASFYILGGHKSIQVVLSPNILIILAVLLIQNPLNSILAKTGLKKKSSLIVKISIFLLIGFFTLPRFNLMHSYGIKFIPQKLRHFRLVEPERTLYNFVNQNTKKNDCILHYYGWGVETTYYYSNRKPCTRFVKPHLILNYPGYIKQLRQELRGKPPKAIIYSGNDGGADLDIEKFENETLNLEFTNGILKSCYKESKMNSVYFPKKDLKEGFSNCYLSFFDK